MIVPFLKIRRFNLNLKLLVVVWSNLTSSWCVPLYSTVYIPVVPALITNGVVEVVCPIGSLVTVTSTMSEMLTFEKDTKPPPKSFAWFEPLTMNPEALFISFEKTESFVCCAGVIVGKLPP